MVNSMIKQFSLVAFFGFLMMVPNVAECSTPAKDGNTLKVEETLQTIDKFQEVINSLLPLDELAPFQVQAQSGNSGGKDPGVTSKVPFLGLDYSTAITILAVLVGLLVIVVIVLYQIQRQLNTIEHQKTEEEESETEDASFWQKFLKAIQPVWGFFTRLNPVLMVLTVIGVVVIVMIFGFYNQAQDLGTQIGYAPDQPVNFSHKLHAGNLEIDCQYCHTGVRKAKSANIPSTGICMNCHNVVKNGKYGGKEIKKVVQSWENKNPIEWIRIHNLPDHVYFNHAQHVKAGNVECEACHGNVKNMEVVHQHAKLEMGWCINCHRNRNVDASNNYYQKTFEFVDAHEKFTVAEMGGTNCQKCHY